MIRLCWPHNIEHNDIQHNDIKHNDIKHNDIKHNDIKHNDIKHNGIRLCCVENKPIMLSDIIKKFYFYDMCRNFDHNA
jgi:hypothetical protein